MTTFADLGLSPALLEALHDVGYESPSPIQEQAIPPLLAGKDVIGQAQTGTGKTAAFGLPMIESIDPQEQTIQALVLTPTRELCIQVTQALRTYGQRKGVDAVAPSAVRRFELSKPSLKVAPKSSSALSDGCLICARATR